MVKERKGKDLKKIFHPVIDEKRERNICSRIIITGVERQGEYGQSGWISCGQLLLSLLKGP